VADVLFEPFRPYVMAEEQLRLIAESEAVRKFIFKISSLEPRLQNFNVQTKKPGNKLLFYTGGGGFGDQIMAWPVAHILSRLGYEIHVLTEPGNTFCWWCFPWVKSVQIIPVAFELFKNYDHHLIFDSVTNHDEHDDQQHPVDCMLNKIGIDPLTVSPEVKAIRPNFTPDELAQRDAFIHGRKIALYQISASNPVRSLSADESAFLLGRLVSEFPDHHWVGLYDNLIPEAHVKAAGGIKAPNLELAFIPSLRLLWAITSASAMVVAPDSMMVHVAGVHGIPCVGLWGPTNPMKRIKYYRNHIPIHNVSKCQLAPCYHTSGLFPAYCPPLKSARKSCELLTEVDTDLVVASIKKLIGE